MSLAARWRYAVRPGVPCSASGVYLVRTRCSTHAHGRRCASPRDPEQLVRSHTAPACNMVERVATKIAVTCSPGGMLVREIRG